MFPWSVTNADELKSLLGTLWTFFSLVHASVFFWEMAGESTCLASHHHHYLHHHHQVLLF